jgi:hypothetical protein
MATPKLEVRTPEPIQAAIRAAAEANGRSFADEVNATLGAKYIGAEDDAPAQVAPRAKKAPKAPTADPATVPGVIKASELSERGVSMKAAMERAGIAEYDPSAKRPQYERRPAKGKGGR